MSLDYFDRRAFLSSAAAVPLLHTSSVSGFLNWLPGGDSRTLVVLELDGGNDGLNTILPADRAASAKARPQLSGTPSLAAEFAEWWPEVTLPDEPVGAVGSVLIYVRNNGDGPAVLDALTAKGQLLSRLTKPSWVQYWRQRPYKIMPGELGQIEIRCVGMPEDLGLSLMRDPAAATTLDVTWSES